MSNDRQRVKRAIQRIAEQSPDIRSLLDAADNKGGKPGAAGVGGGAGSEEGSNTINETRICCDGSTGDPNPGVDENNPDDGGQTGLDPDDPASTDQGGGTLDGVTDCATGEPICFDGAGFIPPDGWDEPDDPPTSDDPDDPNYYDDSSYWDVSYSSAEVRSEFPLGSNRSRTKAQAQSAVESSGIFQNATHGYCVNDSGNSVGVRTRVGPPNYSCIGDEMVTVARRTCDDAYSSTFCGTDYMNPSPSEFKWPSDSCVNLTIKGGKIVGSKHDPENDGSYSAPRDSIDLCSGGNQISLAPSANGGWKTINSTTDNGYLYNSKGEQIAHIDGNEYSDPNV